MVPNERLEFVALLPGSTGDPRWLALAAALVVLLIVWSVKRHQRRPRTGEIWFARVPYRDDTGSKDRPVLVLSVGGLRCSVAQFTSQDRRGWRDYRRVPGGVPGLSKTSWVSTRPVRLRRSAMRRRVGNPGAAFVGWYEKVAVR